MKVLLVNPPAEQELSGNNPEVIETSRGYNPPLGLLYLAAALEQETDHQVVVCDAQVEELDHDALARRVAEEAPEVVGLTVMTFTLLDVMEAVRRIKETRPETVVVLGGPHAHIFPRETLALPGVDLVVVGEGERTLVELLERLGDPTGLRQVPGLLFRSPDGEAVATGPRPLRENLDALPFPARHLTPYQRYSSVMARRHPVTTMFTSRGCPYRCTFCDRPALGKAFRALSAQRVVDEMEHCVEMGIHEFLIYDDTFTVDRARVEQICAEIRRRRLDIGWDFRARTNTVTPELLRELRGAGCERIHYGVEVPNNRLMKVLRKGLKVEGVREVFRATRRAGIETLAYFMIGVPTQTLEEIHETFRFMRQLAPGYVHLTILTPFPGTELYVRGLEDGVIHEDYWTGFARNPRADFEPPYWPGGFSREELHALVLQGYRSFYLRPSYVLRKLVRVRSFGELRRKARAGLNILSMRRFGGGDGAG